MDRQNNKMNKLFLKLIKFFGKRYTLYGTLVFGLFATLFFATLLILSLFMNGGQLNNAQIDLKDIQDIAKALDNCKTKNKENDCFIEQASLNAINENLASINNALKLEETGALIGIFVTVSTVVLPIFLMVNMRTEKSDIEGKLKDIKYDIKDMLKQQKEEINNDLVEEYKKMDQRAIETQKELRSKVDNTKMEILDAAKELVNNRSLTRNKIMLHVYQAKAGYFKDKIEEDDGDAIFQIQNILEIQTRAHEIELNIIKLMSSNKRDVESGAQSLRELLDASDFNKPFMRYVRLAAEEIQNSPDYNYMWQQAIHRDLSDWLSDPDASA